MVSLAWAITAAHNLFFQADVSPETIEALVQQAMEAGSLDFHQRGDRLSVTLNPRAAPPPPGNEEEEGDDDDNTSQVLHGQKEVLFLMHPFSGGR